MTSVAVAPGSLGAPPAMLTPKMYHLQQGLSPSGSPTSGKSYDTLSKGKKSWSVRLGLSRQHQNHRDDPGKGGWGTISGGSILSRQMIYSGDPWLYGTVRSSRLAGHDPARQCGGQRVAGLPFGGTCRLPSSSRSRPSLAGVLRTAIDDPYDQMRRNRLVEPRSRARSISPHRPSSQRDSRSQSVVSRAAAKERKGTTEGTSLSRSEWFDKEPSTVVSYDDRKSRPGFTSGGASSDDWMLDETPESHSRTHSTATSARLTHVSKKPTREVNQRRTSHDDWKNGTTTSVTADSRKSILECNVNPYLLLKKQKDEDDLSDDLSDNALEQDNLRTRSSSLFDSSKVKSIERIPNRSAVAAIGGQRIRVFNERPREISDDDDDVSPPVTRIPIPKVSPKRPPRRLKEARQTLKSILKRGRVIESKRKNVLFNVDNVIFAPEKPSEATRLSWSRIGRIANCEERRLSDERAIRLEDETELEIEIEELKDRLPGIAVDEKDLILKSEENSRKSFLTRSQSDRSFSKPEISAGDVLFSDTMRLSLSKKIKESSSSSSSSAVSREDVDEESSPRRKNETKEIDEETGGEFKNSDREIETSKNVDEIPEKTADNTEKEVDVPPDARSDISDASNEHFRTMRPTSWSPPPGRQRHRFKIGNSTADTDENPTNSIRDHRRTISSASTASWNSTSSYGSSKIEINSPESNVCKITVSPRSSPLVHRLQIGPESSPRGARRTSILINGDQNTNAELTPGNKVTISVGGEDSVCNPTVISVNSENPPKVQNAVENRTLVILQNYKSNIVVESTNDDSRSKQIGKDHVVENSETNLKMNGEAPKSSSDDTFSCRHVEQSAINFEKQKRLSVEIKSSNSNQCSRFYTDERTRPESKTRFKDIESSSKLPILSKEALISKLLEDSLRKARENGEILDEDSGQAILKILKQSLLKSKEYESSESTLEANYSRSSSLNSDGDFISTNLFLEENPYEVIKEPIYEEIPDEPPPLPLSPPPTEDYIKDRIYFGDVEYYKKITPDQFLGPYLSEEVFKKSNSEDLAETYLSKSPEDFFKKMSMSPEDENNISTKFELLSFLMDSKDRTRSAEEDEDEDEDEEDDAEGDLEALYEQKETSLGDLSSKSSQISNVSDSSEECNIILTSSPETLKSRTVDIERTDSGVGSESSQASSTRCVARRWRTGNVSSGPGSLLGGMPQVISGATKLCEDCEQRLDPLITDSGVVYAPFVCRKCSKKRAERKEIITEIVETEQKYGRDLQIILEEFHRPMFRAGLLTSEQLSAIFLNVEELLEHNLVLAEKLKDSVELAQESGDEDLLTVDVGKIFLESERMLHAFESYCTRQGGASLLLQNLEKEKELLRIFLRVSQMENTVLRRMNLNSFLMVPVQRVTKYPLLLARLLKATPSVRPDIQEAKKRLKQAQTNIELHLEHMNAEAKDVTSTKLWRRISIIQNGRRSVGEQDMVNIKLRKMAVEILEWAHEDARFVLEGRLLVAQPTDNNWRRGRTVKLAPVIAMLVTNGKPNADYPEFNDESLFPKHIGIKEATLLLVKEKLGRYSLLREPLYLDKCIVCCETDLEDYFEIQELSSKETFIFKAEDGARTKRWCRTLQAHAQSLGAWRKRRGALPNIMICGVARN
ncbi:Myosin-M heavy chain [Trachymyrmex zeteki]|uniref:Myosin-M heavy chain n=1 Tax=Mycetomoellerius zeteki TaxID=64791 RepID=A0A151X226_9HYME|nr:Myosin-M heavy chain [Trachymyrmex zeteki]